MYAKNSFLLHLLLPFLPMDSFVHLHTVSRNVFVMNKLNNPSSGLSPSATAATSPGCRICSSALSKIFLTYRLVNWFPETWVTSSVPLSPSETLSCSWDNEGWEDEDGVTTAIPVSGSFHSAAIQRSCFNASTSWYWDKSASSTLGVGQEYNNEISAKHQNPQQSASDRHRLMKNRRILISTTPQRNGYSLWSHTLRCSL